MIKKMPRRLPTLADMLRDLSATPEDIATALHVNASTVYRWINQDRAPRPAMLALYWMTRWGQSEINAELWNRANVYEGLAKAMERELYNMQSSILRLGQIGEFGSANDPLQTHRAHGHADGLPHPSPINEPYKNPMDFSPTQPLSTAHR
jgi:predicted DNA-binding transcriptional regulator AlpA